MTSGIAIRRLETTDVPLLRKLTALFGEAFGESDTYGAEPPSESYLACLLGKDHVAVVVAEADREVVGGLVAYELDKFEKQRREVYIYDLAVAAAFRRQGITTALIDHLCGIARARGAPVVFVQADYGDDPAVALYGKLGLREEVLHFDIATEP